jgi:hypothetical protein
LALTLSSFKGGEIMSNIYSMPLMIRRGGTKVKNLGLQTYQGNSDVTKMYYGTGSDDYYPFNTSASATRGAMDLGAQSIELNPGSKPISPFLKREDYYDGLPFFRLLNDVNSYQWVIIRLPEINIPTFCNHLASNNMFEPSDAEKQNMKFYLDDRYNDMSVYPFVYEYTYSQDEITAQKLTTYSEYNPTSAMGDRHQGMETVRIYSTGQFHGISSSWTNKLQSAWTGYTNKLTGSTVILGFLAIGRGGNTANITTRNFIRFFLQRCSNIDTTNDWTHIRLT